MLSQLAQCQERRHHTGSSITYLHVPQRVTFAIYNASAGLLCVEQQERKNSAIAILMLVVLRKSFKNAFAFNLTCQECYKNFIRMLFVCQKCITLDLSLKKIKK